MNESTKLIFISFKALLLKKESFQCLKMAKNSLFLYMISNDNFLQTYRSVVMVISK